MAAGVPVDAGRLSQDATDQGAVATAQLATQVKLEEPDLLPAGNACRRIVQLRQVLDSPPPAESRVPHHAPQVNQPQIGNRGVLRTAPENVVQVQILVVHSRGMQPPHHLGETRDNPPQLLAVSGAPSRLAVGGILRPIGRAAAFEFAEFASRARGRLLTAAARADPCFQIAAGGKIDGHHERAVGVGAVSDRLHGGNATGGEVPQGLPLSGCPQDGPRPAQPRNNSLPPAGSPVPLEVGDQRSRRGIAGIGNLNPQGLARVDRPHHFAPQFTKGRERGQPRFAQPWLPVRHNLHPPGVARDDRLPLRGVMPRQPTPSRPGNGVRPCLLVLPRSTCEPGWRRGGRGLREHRIHTAHARSVSREYGGLTPRVGASAG